MVPKRSTQNTHQSPLSSNVGQAERRDEEARNGFAKFLEEEEDSKDSGGLCQGVLEIVPFIHQKEELAWKRNRKKR